MHLSDISSSSSAGPQGHDGNVLDKPAVLGGSGGILYVRSSRITRPSATTAIFAIAWSRPDPSRKRGLVTGQDMRSVYAPTKVKCRPSKAIYPGMTAACRSTNGKVVATRFTRLTTRACLRKETTHPPCSDLVMILAHDLLVVTTTGRCSYPRSSSRCIATWNQIV